MSDLKVANSSQLELNKIDHILTKLTKIDEEKSLKIQGLEAELDILVEQILTAKDLVELKEVTARNFSGIALNLKVSDSTPLRNQEKQTLEEYITETIPQTWYQMDGDMVVVVRRMSKYLQEMVAKHNIT